MPTRTLGPTALALVIGAGPDKLVIKISQDVWRGSARYTVKVDGKQIGGTLTASASHASGQSDTVTVLGDWGPGEHRVEVAFLNDAWGGGASTDRNLYVDGATYNGQPVAGAKKSLFSNGAAVFSFSEAALPTPPDPPPSGEPVPNAPVSGLRLTFNDDFNSFSWDQGVYVYNSATRRMDWRRTSPGTWKTLKDWNDRWAGNELQYYSDASVGVHPYSIRDGKLHITAARSTVLQNTKGQPFTSGLIQTDGNFAQTYGYFEARIDLPDGKGFFPAFWMQPENDIWPPEIDIMEAVGREDAVHHNVHTLQTGSHTQNSHRTPLPSVHEGFHTYGVSWRPDFTTFYVDGQQTHRITTPSDMHSPQYLMANLAIGGEWAGPPDGTTPFPSDMVIDYIRAWQFNDLA